MSICYDLRFPELFRVLALRGVRIVVLPAAFTQPTTRDHWEPLIRARAIENQVFLVAANQVGKHPGGHHSGGSSLIVDPWGTVLARADGEKPGHIVAELDFEHQDDVRKRVPLLSHRRPKLTTVPRRRLTLRLPAGTRAIRPLHTSTSLPGNSHSRPGTPTGGEG